MGTELPLPRGHGLCLRYLPAPQTSSLEVPPSPSSLQALMGAEGPCPQRWVCGLLPGPRPAGRRAGGLSEEDDVLQAAGGPGLSPVGPT